MLLNHTLTHEAVRRLCSLLSRTGCGFRFLVLYVIRALYGLLGGRPAVHTPDESYSVIREKARLSLHDGVGRGGSDLNNDVEPTISASQESSVEPVSPTPERLSTREPVSDRSEDIPALKWQVGPMFPFQSIRYSRKATITKSSPSYYPVSPYKHKYEEDIPYGWRSYVHPEGSLYFYNPEQNLITDAHILDTPTRTIITEVCDAIKKAGNTHGPSDPVVVELLVEDPDQPDVVKCGYYYVDHLHYTLYWPQDFYVDRTVSPTDVLSDSHLQQYMLAQYWTHREYYPALHQTKQEEIDILTNTLLFAIGDATSSETSTAPWGEKTMRLLYKTLAAFKIEAGRNDYMNAYVGRLAANFANAKFSNLYGQRYARLDSTQSVYDARKRDWTFWFFNTFILFFMPENYHAALRVISVDNIVNQGKWEDVVNRLIQDWQDSLLLGEVMLTVQISFLAVTDIPTLATVATYVSIASTMTSIIIGLLLVSHSRRQRWSYSNADTSMFLHMSFGHENIALMYSLPYCLLLWGMVTFTVAFGALCFKETNSATRAVSAVTFFLCVVFVALCVGLYFLASRGGPSAGFWLREKMASLKFWRKSGTGTDTVDFEADDVELVDLEV